MRLALPHEAKSDGTRLLVGEIRCDDVPAVQVGALSKDVAWSLQGFASSAELLVPKGLACILEHGKAPAPVAKALERVSASLGNQENAAFRLVSNQASEGVLRDALPHEHVCCEALEIVLDELLCDEEDLDVLSPCTVELAPVRVLCSERLPRVGVSVEEAVVEEAVEAESKKTASTMVSDWVALSCLLDGSWSENTYEEWAVKYYKRSCFESLA